MKIYISIPITGKNILLQMRKARMWQRIYESEGHTVINPFDVGYRLELLHEKSKMDPPTHSEYMFHDLMWLSQCNAVLFCEGWRQSRGCTIEYKEARGLRLKLMSEDKERRKL
jgi:hypothetical protein